jgi:hypothetical protein
MKCSRAANCVSFKVRRHLLIDIEAGLDTLAPMPSAREVVSREADRQSDDGTNHSRADEPY